MVVGPTVDVPGHHHPTGPAAAAVLNAAADSAGSQTGGYQHAAYWRSTSTYVRYGETFHRQIWIGHDRKTMLIDPGVDSGVITFASHAPFGAGLTWEQLYALPTDPTALATVLRRCDTGQGRNPDQQLFSTCAELLGESPASPSLRRALYHVAATVPGVRADGTVTDSAGRRTDCRRPQATQSARRTGNGCGQCGKRLG